MKSCKCIEIDQIKKGNGLKPFPFFLIFVKKYVIIKIKGQIFLIFMY
jgi:hypothetical protein